MALLQTFIALREAYVKMQMTHRTDYMRHLTKREREHTLDV
ncbi:MAG: hypothetical protein WA709_34075 [Stellaceae bacterium]